MKSFVDLHSHDTFSLLDAIPTPSDAAKRAKELGYTALCVTNHGEISGWYQTYIAAKKEGLKPILSIEAYVCKDIEDLEENPFKRGVFRCKRGHLIIHPKGNEGLISIRELYNNSWNDYSKKGGKQIIFEHEIIKHAGKIMVQSACSGSYIDSEEKVIRFKEIFGEDFYLEIQPHVLDYEFDLIEKKHIPCEDSQKVHNKKMIEWSRKHNIKLIPTADSHYLTREDKVLQDIVILNSVVGISTGWYFHQDTNHMMDKEQWWEYFCRSGLQDFYIRENFEKDIDNIHEIIEKVGELSLENPPMLIEYPIHTHELYKEGDTKKTLLFKIIKDVGRFNKDEKYIERFKYELKIIEEKNFLDYFLILEDVIRWNTKQGYLIGPARGSSAGSLLAYYLDITKIDPLKYDLLFERFIDLSRTDLPDIDTDFEERDKTIEYITNKYGQDRVLPIGTYQTLKIKSALKAAYKVLYKDRDYDYGLINEVTKPITESSSREDGNQWKIFLEYLEDSKKEYNTFLDKKQNPPKHNLYQFIKDKKDLLIALKKLLGKISVLKLHPASVIITKEPYKDMLPVTKVKPGTSSEKWITSFDGPAVEAVGQVKLDILGLTTLNCISSCLDEIIKYKGTTLECGIDISNKNNIWQIPINIPEVYAKTAEGDTETVFQMLQPLPRRIGMDMVISNANDWIATIAIIRPGPLSALFDKIYIGRKFNQIDNNTIYEWYEDEKGRRLATAPVKYSHPKLDEILKDTYNTCCYQEQVQKVFIELGGFTPIESNKIRKVISKGKDKEYLLTKAKPKFIEYATTKLNPPWTKEQVDAFFDDMIGFGSYCFNKSHSASYYVVGYVCQYLKTFYPLEWWTGNLKHCGGGGANSIINLIKEKEMSPIQEIDINKSKHDFFYNGEQIVMPLKYIKGLGENGLDKIVECQPFNSLRDFVNKVPGRNVRKTSVINLIVSGAFKGIEPNKTIRQLISEYYLDIKKEKTIPEDIQIIMDDNIALEKYKSDINPLYTSDWVEKFRSLFDDRITNINKLSEYADGSNIFIGGSITKIHYNTIKNGKNAGDKMARLIINQLNDSIKATMWPEQIKKHQFLLENKPIGKLVEIRGKLERYNGELQLNIADMKEILI